jgi:putative oxidoreductase
VLGLGGRFAALGLSVLNAVAVISYPALEEAGIQQHVFWGSLLAGLALWGPGPWSLERFLPWCRRGTRAG